jgi:hypothetical protein
MNSKSVEVFSTTIKKIKPKQTRIIQENMIIISKLRLTSTTLETETIVSEPNMTLNTLEKEIITTEEKSKNSLLYIVFGLFVVSLLIIFPLLFVVYLNKRRKRY